MNAGLEALSFSRGSGPALLKNLYFCDFPGGPDLPPLNPRMAVTCFGVILHVFYSVQCDGMTATYSVIYLI